MTTVKHQYPSYPLRISPTTMKKIKSIAEYNGRSLNKEIEQLILRHIQNFEHKNGKIVITDEDD